jgi:transposase
MSDDFSNLQNEIVMKHAENWSIRALSKHFGIGRNRIRRILRGQAKKREQGHDALNAKSYRKRASRLDALEPTIKIILEEYPKITAVRVYEKLQAEADYTGGITQVRERLRRLRPKEKDPVIRFETEPGRQGQMDWSPYTLHFRQTGKCTVLCFSYILGYSRRHYIDFTLRHDFHSLIRRHQDAFSYFSGVPRECLYDNEKTVVLRWEAGRPVYNPAFADFMTHYQCRPIACRPRNPQTKGKVEAPFQYIEKNLLGGRQFQDLDDLRACARWWLKEKSDQHIHDTTGKAPIELFAEERLQALPLHPYDTSEVKLAVCGSEGCITFETNHYSVPSRYIADILTVKAAEHEIMIYNHELELIARHERQSAGGRKYIENPNHRAAKKERYGLEPAREAFLALGEAAEEFLRGLVGKYPRNCGHHARAILRLKQHYLCDDIHQALLHALRYQAFESGAIERILQAKATPRTLESIRNERAGEALQKALPQITQRPLAHYCALLGKEEQLHEDLTSERCGDKDQNTPGNSSAHHDCKNP